MMTIQKPTRCAIYTRVSTDQQAEVEFNSCEAQEDRIRSFIASQDGFQVARVYSDPGFTGANTDRPGLRQLVADVKSGHFDMVVTYKIDRLTRSPRDFYQLIEVFEAHKVGFISVTERFDTSTPAGRLLRNIMLTFAQFERELASERIRDKFAQRAKRGLSNGGPAPFGYRRINGKLIVDAKRAAIVRSLFETYAKTRSIRAARQILLEHKIKTCRGNDPGDSFVGHVLRTVTLTGKVIHKGKLYPGEHEPIISEETFNHVQQLIKTAPRGTPDVSSEFPLAGLIRCRECGSVMSPSHTSKKGEEGPRRYRYYRCTSTNHRGWNSCRTRQISADRFEQLVDANLLRISMDMSYIKNLVFSLKNQNPQVDLRGIEPLQYWTNLNPEILQKALQLHVKNCARKTGISKTLAVRQRIKGILYSPETIRVAFDYGSIPDGQEGLNSLASDSAPQADDSRPGSLPKIEKGSDLLAKSDPFRKFDSKKTWS